MIVEQTFCAYSMATTLMGLSYKYQVKDQGHENMQCLQYAFKYPFAGRTMTSCLRGTLSRYSNIYWH